MGGKHDHRETPKARPEPSKKKREMIWSIDDFSPQVVKVDTTKLSNEELTAELARFGLATGGTKPQKLARLERYLLIEGKGQGKETPSTAVPPKPAWMKANHSLPLPKAWK